MKRSHIKSYKAILTVLFLIIVSQANAQKLPNVQTASLRAPANIKIDGKTTEWDNNFQAYNRATEVFYTLSNDDNYLYLTVQATIPEVISKIIGGGITFTMQKSGKKVDKDGMSITYPIFTKDNRPFLGISMRMSMENGVMKSESTMPPMNDSTINARNAQLREKSKYIGVTGIGKLDSMISVYNEDGIKTAEAINNKGAYTYELAIDLKLLGLSANDLSKFAYHMVLNGLGKPGNMTIKIAGGDGSAESKAAAEAATSELMSKLAAANGNTFSPTDFWGEYTLAKK